MRQNLERNHAMTFRVTEKEREMIRKAQVRTKIKNTRAYLLKMAVDGRVIEIDLESVREMNNLLSNATNNINQIAARANATGNFTPPTSKTFRYGRRKSGYSKKKYCGD